MCQTPSHLPLYPSDEDAGITGPCWIKAHLDPAHQLELGSLPSAPRIEAVADIRWSVEHDDRRLPAELVAQGSQRLGLDFDPAQPERRAAHETPATGTGRAQHLRER